MKLYKVTATVFGNKKDTKWDVLGNNFVMKYILELSFYCINIGPIMVYSIRYIDL